MLIKTLSKLHMKTYSSYLIIHEPISFNLHIFGGNCSVKLQTCHLWVWWCKSNGTSWKI